MSRYAPRALAAKRPPAGSGLAGDHNAVGTGRVEVDHPRVHEARVGEPGGVSE